MKTQLTRRSFLKQTAFVGAAALAGCAAPRARRLPGDKIRIAQIGCGGRAMSHLGATLNEELVAIVDVDEKRHDAVRKLMADKGRDASKIQVFTDYRQMFDKLSRQIDAIFIATPNHHHALPSLIAIDEGINVYCEKPVCHTIAEARQMRAAAAKSKVATQMGNQGHCEEGYRRLCEYIWSGAIGAIRETHSWTNRANGGEGPRPPKLPVPAGLHWDEWIGPAPYRDFHDDLHPHEWHGWYDFGNGSIGNMGCHVLDGLYWALKIEHPTSIEVEQMRGGSEERYPMGSRVRWDIPARADMPPVKVYWYEGLRQDASGSASGNLRTAKGDDRNFPALMYELRKQFPDEELDGGDSGTLYVGEKGVIFTGTYGDKMHIVPYAKMQEAPQPPKILPRSKGIFVDFLDAVRSGKKETSVSFDYGTRLTEFALLGNLAQHAGAGRKVMWDGPRMKVTNFKELNALVKRAPRRGWRA